MCAWNSIYYAYTYLFYTIFNFLSYFFNDPYITFKILEYFQWLRSIYLRKTKLFIFFTINKGTSKNNLHFVFILPENSWKITQEYEINFRTLSKLSISSKFCPRTLVPRYSWIQFLGIPMKDSSSIYAAT